MSASPTLSKVRAGYAATNPLTRIVALIIITTPLLLSIDVVSAGVTVILTLCLLPFTGLSPRTVFYRALPLLFAMPLAGLSMLLYGKPGGTEYFSFLFAHVTENSVSLALAIMLRVLAVGLPAIVLLSGIDPTDLGDSLAQLLKLPARFVLSAVAAVRMVSLFQSDWQSMKRARRARGIDQDRKIFSAISMSFGLLVLALRRGSKLATAMEARAFGKYPSRTWARKSRLRKNDLILLLVCVLIVVIAITTAVGTGSFKFVGS